MTILKRTSPEVNCLHPTSSEPEMCTSSVGNVIYHKFSHGTAFYTLNGKNVNVMLVLTLTPLKHILFIDYIHEVTFVFASDNNLIRPLDNSNYL